MKSIQKKFGAVVNRKIRDDQNPKIVNIPAVVGTPPPIVVDVVSRKGYIYATARNGVVYQVLNELGNIPAGHPIMIGNIVGDEDTLRVMKIQNVFFNKPSNILKLHGSDHSYGRKDPTPIWMPQFMWWKIDPVEDFTIRIYRGVFVTSTGDVLPPVIEDIDLTSHIPVSGCIYVLVEVLTDGTINIVDGADSLTREQLDASFIPAKTAGAMALYAISLYNGQTKLSITRDWNDFYDLRLSNFGSTAASGSVLDPYRLVITDAAGSVSTDGQFYWELDPFLGYKIPVFGGPGGQTSVPGFPNFLQALVLMAHEDDRASLLNWYTWGDSSGTRPVLQPITSGGAKGAETPLTADRILFEISGKTFDGSSYSNTVFRITAKTSEDINADAHGTHIVFEIIPAGGDSTTPILAGDYVQALDITDAGLNIPAGFKYLEDGVEHVHAGMGTSVSPQVIFIQGEDGEGSFPIPGSAGATGATGPAGSIALFDHYADAGNGTTVETDLYSDTIAANQLSADGDKLLAEYSGLFVSSATATRQIKLKFAGTTIFDTGALTLSLSAAWFLEVLIIRASATIVRYSISLTTEGAALAAYTATGELTGLTLSATNIIKITGQAAGVGAATNDILAKLGFVWFVRALSGGALVIVEEKQRSWFL